MTEPSWLTAFRDITNATNERTVISSALGPYAVGNKAPLYDVSPKAAAAAAMLLASLDSIVLDWAARFSVGGTNLNYFIVKQLPVLGPETFLEEAHPRYTYAELIATRVLELTYTAWDLEPFAHDLGYDGPPFKWDEERRFLIRCELDAAFFHLYLGSEAQWKATGSKELSAYFPTPRRAVEYIMASFPIVKRKDEQKYGSFRTKDTILEIYDEMQRVMAENAAAVAAGRQPTACYQTRLNPPPGPPCDAAGNFIPMAEWDRANWPAHIHQPRDGAAARPTAATGPGIIVATDEIDIVRLLEAFRQVRQGMSADYMVADPKANTRFQEAARALGLRAEPMRLNRALLNARKAGKLKDEPSDRQYRLSGAYEPYVFASEWAVRHLQRELLREINRMPALDELLCHPGWAARFDELAARIKPGFEPIDYRWAVLGMRKKGRCRPAEKTVEMPMQRQLALDSLLGDDLPADPGLYLIRSGERPLYVNWADDLLAQVRRHRELAGDELIPLWLLEGIDRADDLRYVALRGLRARELQEMRIAQVARLEPWLNLLDFGEAA